MEQRERGGGERMGFGAAAMKAISDGRSFRCFPNHRHLCYSPPPGHRQLALCFSDHNNFAAHSTCLFPKCVAAGTPGIRSQGGLCVCCRHSSLKKRKAFSQSGHLKLEGSRNTSLCSGSREDRLIQRPSALRTRHNEHIEPFTQPGNLQLLVHRPRKFCCLCMGSEDQKNTAALRRARNINNMLMVAEGICIVGAIASQTACLLTSAPRKTRHISASTGQGPALFKHMRLSTWQVFPLWIALLINAIIRARQTAFPVSFIRNGDKRHDLDANLVLRVKNLEEDLGNGLTIMRSLARQFEKLGVRFRVTRRTLRDPIQETALLSQKTSDIVKALTRRNDALEEEIKSIHRVLLSMQEQQVKQLELISKVVDKTSKTNKPLHSRVSTAEEFGVHDGKVISCDKIVKKSSLERRPGGLQKIAKKLEDVRMGLRKWSEVVQVNESKGKDNLHSIQTSVMPNMTTSCASELTGGTPSPDSALPGRSRVFENGQTKMSTTAKIDFWTTPLGD
ncbi:hypothetical protein O6H91_Y306100 [Diphasiastrum complanatum]|nr:hypothetical protein O6H91_Y306100 [Diphasiastrum complanatum]